MFYTYILHSINQGHYYIGSCENVDERIDQHNSGNVKSTKRYAPWKLEYKEEFRTRRQAVQREREIKSWKSRKAIGILLQKHF